MFNRRSFRKGSIMILPLAAFTTMVCLLTLAIGLSLLGVKLPLWGLMLITVIVFLGAAAAWACILPR